MWYGYPDMGWWMLTGIFSMVLFWAVVIGLTVWTVRRFTEPRQPQMDPSPLDIARARYARGELTREQFEQFREDLQPTTSTTEKTV